MSSNKRFMSKENMQVILGIFTQYMNDTAGIQFKGEALAELKQTVFTMMNAANENTEGKTIHQLNLEVLGAAKDHYTAKSIKKPSIKKLEREQEVFGKRPLTVNELIPRQDPYSRKPDMDRYIHERDEVTAAQQKRPDISRLGQQITEKPEATDDFLRKLESLKTDRNTIDVAIAQQNRNSIDDEFRTNNTLENQDPKQLYTINDNERFRSDNMDITRVRHEGGQGSAGGAVVGGQMMGARDDDFTTAQSLIIPPPGTGTGMGGSGGAGGGKITLQKYISINSTDRAWTKDVQRYAYPVTFNGAGISGNYKDIRSIEVGKVVIPEEINENINILNYPSKTQFNQEFSFSYPYLILRIDEFNDVYDGTNDHIRKSFCKLVYHRHYKAPNGRGYVILKPFQKEKKQFYPTPLSSLSRLTISILKPNGFLLNTTSDNYKVFKVDYDSFNPHYYHIVCDAFFDKNEFYVGDVVVFKGFAITSSGFPVNAQMVTQFINRPEGHEVTQIGTTNGNGFYRSFYITALGQFNRTVGQFETDMGAVSAINEYNNGIDYTTYKDTNGNIMNSSLQNTIGMSIDVVVNDASAISS